MANTCRENMEARSPQSAVGLSSSESKGHCNYKKLFISMYNKEENIAEEEPPSPQLSKPMPPLEPLVDEIHAFVPVHPKKRLKMEHDDPMLAEAAASPTSCNKPCSPTLVLSRIANERLLKSPTADTYGAPPENIQPFSGPDSPYSSLYSTLEPNIFGDFPYSPSFITSPSSYQFSPGSATHANSPGEFFPSSPSLAKPPRSPLQEKDPHILPPTKAKQQQPLSQKQCQRPQSVALDLTSLQKQKPSPGYAQFQHPSPQQHLLSPHAHLSTIPTIPSEGQHMAEVRNGFQRLPTSQGILAYTTHPQVPQHRFDRAAGIVPPSGSAKNIYSQNNLQQVFGTLTSRQNRMPRLQEGGGVIRPKPTHFFQKPMPNHLMHHHPQRGRHQYHHIPSGSQSKRMPSEMISNAGFPRDMPSVQPPTASTKTIPWLHGDGEGTKSTSWLHGDAITPRASHSSLGKYCSSNSNDLTYKQKPIHTWQDQDIMYFMFDATKELKIEAQDIICSQMAGLTGKDLIQMNVDDFKKYCPRTAELMYQHFRARLQEERAQQQQAAAARAVPPHQSNPNHRLGPEASPVEFITQSSNFFPLSHQHPSHPPDMLMTDSPRGCDIPAPYEIHTKTIETIDHRLIGIDEVDDRRLSGGFPSASRKSFPLLHAASPVNPYDVEESISEPEQSIEEVKPEPPKKRGPGRPRKPENELKKKKKKTGRLWEFIRNLLLDPETCPSLVRWENAEEGIFKFVQADKVAQKWGERKQNKEMNYEKLSRAMRYYYKGGVFEAVFGRRLVYKFGKNAKGWQPSNPNFANRSEPYLHSSRR